MQASTFTLLISNNIFFYNFSSDIIFEFFQAYLHEPTSIPEVKERGFSIPPGSEMFVAIQPTSVYSTEGILSQTPERRKCWLPNEQGLKYHVNYTRANCLTECMAEKMEEVCGCVPYYVFKPGELHAL